MVSPRFDSTYAATKTLCVTAILLAVTFCHPPAVCADDLSFTFVNVADSTGGFSAFGDFPAMNNSGAVAFVAIQAGVGQGVFRATRGTVTPIATVLNGMSQFGDDVAMNFHGVVAFDATLPSGARAIFTGDGTATKTIANSLDAGLLRIGIGPPSINASGTVAFNSTLAAPGFPVSIFTGNGGPLTTVAATSKTGFQSFGAAAINDSGTIVFHGFPADGSEGVFVGPNATDVADTNNPAFSQFGDPVINRRGTVADFVSLTGGGIVVFTSDGRRFTPRTDPLHPQFVNSEHPSINSLGAVAFSAQPVSGGLGIFVEVTGGDSPTRVLQTGDPLFGSTVTSVSVGRFAFNDRFQVVFEYTLKDGRSGVAVGALRGEAEEDGGGDR